MLDLIIHTNRPLTAAEIAELEGMGLSIVAAVDSQSYRLRGESDVSQDELRALDYVVDVEPFSPAGKLDKSLLAAATSAAAVAVAGGLEALDLPPVRVLVSLDAQMDVQNTLAELDQIGEVEQSSGRRALLSVDRSRLADVASLPGVLNAEVEPDPSTQNNVARSLIGVNPVAPALGLDGSGEIVGVADSGLDTGVNDATMLADFSGRVVNIRATVNKAAFGVADGADLNNHGTHVSGSILGDGSNSNGNLAGMAPAAQITMLSMGPNNSTSLNVPFDLTTGVFQDAYNDGARLHNNSWGDGSAFAAGAYTAYASDVDEFIRDNPDMLVLIAAGNEGSGAGTVTPPGTAKNCLTVGAAESVRPLPATISINPNFQDHDFNPATPDVNFPLSLPVGQLADDVENIATFSSRGPTDDGRIKPDIIAPGTFILSCRSQVSTADVGPDGLAHVGNLASFYANDADGTATHPEAVGRGLPGGPFYGTWNQNTPAAPAGSGPNAQDNYFYDSGTSMATPITTGATALLRQYLRQHRGIANPSAALMKAMLVNGATVPAGASNAPDNTRGFGWLNMENTITPDPTGQQTYSDDVDLAVATGDVRTFSVQIADTSHPFRVTLAWTDAPGSGLQNRLYLRVIAPDATITDGDITPFPNPSNNVQRVHIASPQAGTYTVEVRGIAVINGISALPGIRQDFALAIINGVGFSPEPVDVCQVVDKSGSMAVYGFMAPARERAKQFVDLLRVNDRTGVVAFNGTPDTVNVVEQINGFATQDAIKTNIDTITTGGVTSIGGGLDRGRIELAAGGDPAHPQAMVLMSDGHENTPPWVGGGVTDSPPAWYGGPDFTEVLPTIPAGIKIYTVSLGVQSDQVLLQDIATATGGVFHAIHSAADIQKLHEIYVHLQALTGGEEVIASGSSSVDGLSIGTSAMESAGAAAAMNGANSADGALMAELQGLTNVSAHFSDPSFLRRFVSTRVHRIQVDETLETLTLMVSWHDPELPVQLSLITPSQRVIKPGNPTVFNRSGSSYQFFRIVDPEPGEWQMVVRSLNQDNSPRFATHAYTYGAYGKTPLGIRVHLPRQLVGVELFKLQAKMAGLDDAARTLRFITNMQTPRLSLDELLRKHRDALAQIDLRFEPDNPRLDPSLFKLALLDQLLQREGKASIFSLRHRRMSLTRNNDYTDALETPAPGLYPVRLVAVGTSAAGFRYRRQTNFDVRL